MPRKLSVGPEMVAFGGVVVDHVEDDLDAGVVQARHGRAERVERVVGRVARLGREEAERVVAPIVAQAALDQMPVVDEGVDRQQLDRGHAEPLEVIDHRRAPPARETCRAMPAARPRAAASGP